MAGRLSTPVGLALASLVVALSQTVLGTADTVAFVLPLLFVAVPLLCGHFVGERAIARATARRRHARHARPAAAPRTRVIPRALIVRGGRLIAASLAERPPPALPA